MTLRHLQIFKMVCDCGSITSAADKLNMSQPSVSIAIKELEAFYQTKLFDRLNRGIYITESGEALLGYAENVLTAFQESVLALRESSNFTKCRLGVNMAVAESFLPNLSEDLNKAIPKLQMNLAIGNSADIETKLLSDQIDFAIVDSVAETPAADSIFLFQEPMSLLCAKCFDPKKIIDIKELSYQPIYLREKQSGSRQCVDAVFLKHGYVVSPVVESNSTLSLLALAKKQFGYIFLPRSLALKECKDGELCEIAISDDEFLRHYFLVYNKRKHLTPTMELLKDCIIDFFSK